MTNAEEENWMRIALAEAKKGLGLTSPNPAVGAVVVRDGRELSRGWHRECGQAHAEREALAALQPGEAQGATIFVTLEPCSTPGRTGACCDALIEAGLARVVYGTRDPNPDHAGRADEILRTAGIAVASGVLEKECRHLIRGFEMTKRSGRPWVIAKTAISLDGRITRPPGEGQWLSGKGAREEVQWLRCEVDAIITSGATVRADDPALTVRSSGAGHRPRQPRRVVLTRSEHDWSRYRIFSDQDADRSLLFPDQSLYDVLRTLSDEHGVCTVLVEAGGELLGSFQDEGLIDEWAIYLAPLVTGGPAVGLGGKGAATLASRTALRELSIHQVGPDLCARGLVQRGEPPELER